MFSDDMPCGIFIFSSAVCSLCVFGAMSVQIFGHLLTGLFEFLLWNFRSSWCILDTTPSSEKSSADIFSGFVAYLLAYLLTLVVLEAFDAEIVINEPDVDRDLSN